MATKSAAGLALNLVRKSAEKIRNGDPATIEVMSPGDVVRQGDIYITRLDECPREAAVYLGRQLAPGATQGSRHVVEGACVLFSPSEDDAVWILGRLIPSTKSHRQFLGPVISASESITIAHPEHGHRTLPAGNYQVTYQRTRLDSELRRAED